MLRVGPEQLLVFVSTIIGVLATDLLIGVAIGIAVKLAVHAVNGVPLRSLMKPYLEVVPLDEGTVQINARGSAVFTNWIPFRREIERLGLVQRQNVVVNLAGTALVDHSVMEKLQEVEFDFTQAGLRLEVIGLEAHHGVSGHPRAARRLRDARMRAVTVTADARSEAAIAERLRACGVESWTVSRCRSVESGGPSDGRERIRVEAIVAPDVSARALKTFGERRDTSPKLVVTSVPVEAILSDVETGRD